MFFGLLDQSELQSSESIEEKINLMQKWIENAWKWFLSFQQ